MPSSKRSNERELSVCKVRCCIREKGCRSTQMIGFATVTPSLCLQDLQNGHGRGRCYPPSTITPPRCRPPCHPPFFNTLPSFKCLPELRCHHPPFSLSFISVHSVMPDWEDVHPLGLGQRRQRNE